MSTVSAHDEISIIKEMIEKTKRSTADSGFYLILWAVLAIVAVAGMYVLVFLQQYKWIWLNWFLFMGIGAVVTVVINKRQEKKQKVRTYAQTTISYLWTACGVAFMLFGFLFPLLGLYSYKLIAVFVCVIAGVGIFVTGGIVEWNLLKWCGSLWWAGALAMIWIHPNYRALAFIPLIIIGYLMPGIFLNLQYRKRGMNNGS